MTKEEAIEILSNTSFFGRSTDDIDTALDMAISALSAEPFREADDYENEIADLHNRLNIAEYDKERYKEEITTLEAKNKGEWIEVVEEKFPNGEKRMWHYECSACGAGEPFYPINKEHWDFCPNCGADMRPEPYKESEVINGSQEI